MSRHNQNALERQLPLSRREILAAGMTGATGAMFGLVSVPGDGSAQTAAAAIDEPISPGYFASQYYGEEEEEALLDVLESDSPFRFGGPSHPDKVERFEEAYTRYMGAEYALGVTSGTAALDCAVAALEIGPGDEVILPAYTWWSD